MYPDQAASQGVVRSVYSVYPDQATPVRAVRSGSTLFVSRNESLTSTLTCCGQIQQIRVFHSSQRVQKNKIINSHIKNMCMIMRINLHNISYRIRFANNLVYVVMSFFAAQIDVYCKQFLPLLSV